MLLYNLKNYLNAGAHYIVIGEGEETMAALYNAIIQKGDIATVSGIAYLQNGAVTRTQTKGKNERPLSITSSLIEMRSLWTSICTLGKKTMDKVL